jgi:DNA-binding CsgD family transcriptional regulator
MELATAFDSTPKNEIHHVGGKNLERDAFLTVIDALSAAVFVVDATARVTQSNDAADHLIAHGDFVVREGKLAAGGPAGHIALRAALAKSDGQPALIALRTASGPLIAALLPVRADGTFAVIVNRQPKDSAPIDKALMQAFGLTRREANVLIPLLRGQSIEAAAAELGIAVPTARSHLHKLLAKTETTRQGELIQKVLDLLPPVALKA